MSETIREIVDALLYLGSAVLYAAALFGGVGLAFLVVSGWEGLALSGCLIVLFVGAVLGWHERLIV